MSIVDLTADPTPAVAGLTQDIADPAAEARPEVLDLTRPLSQPGQAEAAEPSAASATVTDPVEASHQALSTSTRPTFTITDAATACAVSRKTITRKLADLSEHGAAKDDDGVWRIPVEALLAVGLHPGRSLPSGPRPAISAPRVVPSTPPRPERMSSSGSVVASPRSESHVTDVVTISRDRWDDLRLRLARAEAEAAERALALADARLALRALTAAPSPAPRDPASAPPVASVALPVRSGLGSGNVTLPEAAGWVMGQVAPVTAGAPAPTVPPSVPVADPGAAPAVAVVPPPPRKRRWWQSAAR